MSGTTVTVGRDGVRVSGYLAEPAGTPRAGLIVIHAWSGLTEEFPGIAERFAAEGYLAFAVDLYHGVVTQDMEESRRMAEALDHAQVGREVDAAVAWLRAERGMTSVGCVGYCMGGTLTLETALRPRAQVDAVHVYYGTGIPGAAALARIRVPLMGSYGAEDAAIPLEDVERLRSTLAAQHVPHDVRVYPGAGHAFFNSGRMHHEPSAADSWRRTLEWFGAHLAAAPAETRG